MIEVLTGTAAQPIASLLAEAVNFVLRRGFPAAYPLDVAPWSWASYILSVVAAAVLGIAAVLLARFIYPELKRGSH
jgi:hypothetical protein